MKIDEVAKTLLNCADVIPITITNIEYEVPSFDIEYRGVVASIPSKPMHSHSTKRKFEAIIKDNQEIDIESKYVLLKIEE